MVINLNNNSGEEIDVTSLQKETMETMKEYIGNLLPKLSDMVSELRSGIQEDMWEYLRMMIDGFNWVLEAYNGTSVIINADGSIDEGAVQKAVDDFGNSYIDNNAEQTADVIESGIIPFLKAIECKL